MLKITIDNRKAQLRIKGLRGRVADLRPALINFHTYTIRRTTLMFRKLGKRGGGEFRGVKWPWFADQYTRKTDGVTVPAYGGVRRLRTGKSGRTARGRIASGAFSDLRTRELSRHKVTREPTVRGRLRRSGTRVTRSSNVMIDTGQLFNAALTEFRLRQNKNAVRVIMDTPVRYAERVHKKRPFQFFEDPRDVTVLEQMILKRLAG